MQKMLGDILRDMGCLSSGDLSRALTYQMRKIVPEGVDGGAESFLLDVARTKYNNRNEFFLGKILTELKLLPEGRVREALEIQRTVEQEKPRGKLDALRSITTRINGSYNLIDLLNQVLVFAAQLVEAESSSLIVHDHRTDSLVILMPTGPGADAVREQSIPSGRGIAGWVYENSHSVISNDLAHDRRFYQTIDTISGYRSRQILCVPLTVKDKKLGAVEVINKAAPGTGFSSSDRLLLELFSAQAAIAIENTRLTISLARAEEDASRRQDGCVQEAGARAAAQLSASFLRDLEKTFIPLRGYAEKLRDVSQDDRVRKYRDYIDAEMSRLIRRCELTRGFLVKEVPFAPRTLDLAELLRELSSRVWVDCRLSGIAFEIAAGAELRVRADRELLLSGLECIFRNSREAMPDGGAFSIEAARPDPSWVNMRIRDTGRGFAARPIERVFEPFFTQGRPNAAGLGLSIAKWVVEMHGGTIAAAEREAGAQLIISLPAG